MIKYMIALTISAISFSNYATGFDGGIERWDEKPLMFRFLKKRGINYKKLKRKVRRGQIRYDRDKPCNTFYS